MYTGPSVIGRSPLFGDDATGLFYVRGRFSFDPNRTPPFIGSGKVVDLCAALS